VDSNVQTKIELSWGVSLQIPPSRLASLGRLVCLLMPLDMIVTDLMDKERRRHTKAFERHEPGGSGSHLRKARLLPIALSVTMLHCNELILINIVLERSKTNRKNIVKRNRLIPY
jgi:hypothetical protein